MTKKPKYNIILASTAFHVCIAVARGASYRYPLPWPGPAPLATGTPPPLAVGFAEFALDKTALGREAAVTR